MYRRSEKDSVVAGGAGGGTANLDPGSVNEKTSVGFSSGDGGAFNSGLTENLIFGWV